MSGVAPAPNGTMIRTDLFGQSCASDDAAVARSTTSVSAKPRLIPDPDLQ